MFSISGSELIEATTDLESQKSSRKIEGKLEDDLGAHQRTCQYHVQRQGLSLRLRSEMKAVVMGCKGPENRRVERGCGWMRGRSIITIAGSSLVSHTGDWHALLWTESRISLGVYSYLRLPECVNVLHDCGSYWLPGSNQLVKGNGGGGRIYVALIGQSLFPFLGRNAEFDCAT